MRARLRGFHVDALYDAVDAERDARGLTWSEVTAEINAPFAFVTSRPISRSTIVGMRQKRSVTSAVVLQVLRWLRRSPESFLAGAGGGETGAALPEIPPSQILRVDTRALYSALDAARVSRGLSWRQVASELEQTTESMLRNLKSGPLIGFPQVMRIAQWLGQPASLFVRGYDR